MPDEQKPRADALIDPTLPEPVQAFLRSGGRLESFRLDGEGRFWHEGQVFDNERLRSLFHRSVDRSAGGTWILRIGPFVYPMEVEDTPLHVRSLRVEGEGPSEAVRLRLSDDSEETLDPATLAYDPARGLSCAVKSGRFRARFNRAAAYGLAERLEESEPPRLRLAGVVYPVPLEPAPR